MPLGRWASCSACSPRRRSCWRWARAGSPTGTATTCRSGSPSSSRSAAACAPWPRPFSPRPPAFSDYCLAATLVGAGANFAQIAIQRTAGRMSGEPTELKRIFSWLGLAPALANVVGPILAGAAHRPQRLRPRLRRARAAAAREPRLVGPGAARDAAGTGAGGAQRQRLEPAADAGVPAPAARQLAALVELGRAQLPGADPRPRARLLGLGDRSGARRLRGRRGGGAAGDSLPRAPPLGGGWC